VRGSAHGGRPPRAPSASLAPPHPFTPLLMPAGRHVVYPAKHTQLLGRLDWHTPCPEHGTPRLERHAQSYVMQPGPKTRTP